jgi:5'-3' exonuclease
MFKGKVLVDGDIVAYRAAFSTQDLFPEDAERKVDELMDYILTETLMFPDPSEYEVFLTGSGNFRYDIAKSFPYKGNRKSTEKPIHLPVAREYLVTKYKATVSEGEEADDLIAIAATKYGPETIVASVDKDMLQIPCKHFNFTKGEWHDITEFEGTKFFYKQILTGDRADNIMGLYKVGPVKAEKIVKDCNTEEELWDAVLNAYDGDIERVVENARLLWLRRKEGEIWQPPTA